jgi:hypothetical protein
MLEQLMTVFFHQTPLAQQLVHQETVDVLLEKDKKMDLEEEATEIKIVEAVEAIVEEEITITIVAATIMVVKTVTEIGMRQAERQVKKKALGPKQ